MAMKDFEWKKFMIQKGERVALGVAGFLTFLLLAFNVKSFLDAGPASHAHTLDSNTKKLKDEQARNTPKREDDKPEEAKEALSAFTFGLINDPSVFQVASLFAIDPPIDSNRRQPKLFMPIEGKVAVVTSQLRTYILRENDRTHELEIKVKVSDPAGTAVPLDETVVRARQPGRAATSDRDHEARIPSAAARAVIYSAIPTRAFSRT